MSDINCPYCGKSQDINHDDGYGYEEETLHEQQCGSCGKTFVYETSISYFYEPFKADCLNDGKHDYQPTQTWPKYASMMRCITCGNKRNPTDEERIKFGLLQTNI